jgi:hypothetical protein
MTDAAAVGWVVSSLCRLRHYIWVKNSLEYDNRVDFVE